MKPGKIFILACCIFYILTGCGKENGSTMGIDNPSVVSLGTDWQKDGFKLKSANNAEFMETLMNPSLMMHEIGWQELPLYHSGYAYEYMDTVSAYAEDTLYLWHNYYLKD